MIKKCTECQCEVFRIDYSDDCDDCPENGAWDKIDCGGYIHDADIIAEKGLIRDCVNNEGECRMGDAYGAGCHMYICVGCGEKTHCPTYEE
jgi:hypothetical protein